MDIRTKRIYEAPADDDGARVLVDRLWPRGVARDRARLDLWAREVAPSTELRQWFAHEKDRWPEFVQRYQAEMAQHPDAVAELLAMARRGRLTLLFGAREKRYNQAVVLQRYLEQRLADAVGEIA